SSSSSRPGPNRDAQPVSASSADRDRASGTAERAGGGMGLLRGTAAHSCRPWHGCHARCRSWPPWQGGDRVSGLQVVVFEVGEEGGPFGGGEVEVSEVAVLGVADQDGLGSLGHFHTGVSVAAAVAGLVPVQGVAHLRSPRIWWIRSIVAEVDRASPWRAPNKVLHWLTSSASSTSSSPNVCSAYTTGGCSRKVMSRNEPERPGWLRDSVGMICKRSLCASPRSS